jgi:hypothetical protein
LLLENHHKINNTNAAIIIPMGPFTDDDEMAIGETDSKDFCGTTDATTV